MRRRFILTLIGGAVALAASAFLALTLLVRSGSQPEPTSGAAAGAVSQAGAPSAPAPESAPSMGEAPPVPAAAKPTIEPPSLDMKAPGPPPPAPLPEPTAKPPTVHMKGSGPPPSVGLPKPDASQSPGVATATTVAPAFPWPPPAASAEHVIRNAWVTKGPDTKLSDVAAKLEEALEDADYETWRYLSVPHGFALVTQIEQIRPDGTPRSGNERFRTDLPSFSDMTFVEFLKALAKAPPGYYRVIVFVVTDTPFSQSEQAPAEKEAQQWLRAGLNQLPKTTGALSYGDGYRSTALIYEFRKPSKKSPATFVPKSSESGRIHLEKAGIWDALTR